ncbi:MAG: polyprenyl synthetase family protein [Deltaproteobacteria bacterium]|nr:polyprenyl synthetase family protein [Deltaproteobacteria bacterium]
MNEAARNLPPAAANALLTVLEEELGTDLGRLLGEVGPSVPPEAWDAALLRPLRDFLGRGGKRFRERFASLCWELAGRTDQPPELLPLLIEYVHAGSLIVDDVQDDSPVRRGDDALHVRYGVPLALNAGNWLYFFPLVMLERLGLAPVRELALHRQMARTMLRCHFGQALDLAARCWAWDKKALPALASAITELKTASLFALSASIASEAAGADVGTATALAVFAGELGTALQQLDDLGNLRAGRAGSGSTDQVDPKRHEDLRGGRVTYAWALAAEVLSEDELDQLQADALDVAEGGGDVLALARSLDRAVGEVGRQRVGTRLRLSLRALRDAVGDGPVIDEMRREIERLEASYG